VPRAGAAPVGTRPKAARRNPGSLCYHPAAREAGFPMPNIKQQQKRVRIASRQRLENLRYRSTIKTLTKRLEGVVAEGDGDAVETEHRKLVSLIDRATAHGALHRNAAARKKSQVARIVAGA
jgi:small subunit ribosomal protein S20